MNEKIIFHHHHNKIKFGIISFLVLVVLFIVFNLYTSFFSIYTSGQCRDIFDSQPIETQKKICCDTDHYNSKDSLCKTKCDFLNITPESSFCTDLKATNSTQNEIVSPKEYIKEAPKCNSFLVKNFDSNESNNELKPSNPLNFEMNVSAQDIQPSYFMYEFFTIKGNDIYSIKPISFEKNKTVVAVNPAKYSSNGIYKDSITALHNFFYKENLNDSNSKPTDILVVTSIIDSNGKKHLQPLSCFARFKVDQTPTYCKSFKVSQEKLDSNEFIKFSIESNTPTTYSYEFKFLNLDNYSKSGGDKVYKPISFEKLNNSNNPYTITKIANGSSKISFELSWNDFFQKDLNFKNKYPENIKVEAYIKPYEKTNLNELAPCTLEFEVGNDEGIDNCKDISISGGSKDASGATVLKKDQYLTIKSVSKSKNIENFLYTFHNLDNLNSSKLKNDVKDAEPIFFKKEESYEIEKSSNKSESKSILISYDDINKIDLSTGSKPKNIQIRAFFTNSEDRISKLDSDCVTSFKLE